MENHSSSNRRLAKNTLMLYARMLLVMFVTLYTSRVVLRVLGVEDYGIYSVVGGIVVSFSILSNAMSGAISRFITFSLGQGDIEKVRKLFGLSVSILFCIGVLIIVCAEIIGSYLLNTQMNIPCNRIGAVNILFQFSLAIFIIRLFSVPFNALIISNERMSIYAYFGIGEALLQLIVVFVLQLYPVDKLIMYGFLLSAVTLIYVIMQYVYCRNTFSTQMARPTFDKGLFKEMASFAGWNFIGTSAGILKNQGVDIIVNVFTGVAINAARGIALQVNTAVASFSENFITALRPQIIKTYVADDKDHLNFLVEQGARFSGYLLLFITIPLILETNTLLQLWLKVVPPHTGTFARLQLIDAVAMSLSQTLIIVLLATGKIRNYQLVVGGITLLNMPLSWLLLYCGFPVWVTYVVSISLNILCLVCRLLFANHLANIAIARYLRKVVIHVIIVACASVVLPIIMINIMEPSLQRVSFVITTCILTTSLSIFYVGMTAHERIFIYSKALSLINKYHNK
ncbi:lipopolysaccharide biosynthesis protein [Akkermansia sp. N21116]|jgi:O-antigen/teichoic acid export membrane protein|uniref:hypothetical protein n=1 Tax=Akkermansia sp. N21116 TaxID=3040764 RepID=UPI00244E875F|nr:hypothetical protein [Akkermansia sp. N21116]WPX41449.1 lipopolysaccharide biosynthesis protein [Akkermansia sp. N21116]